MNIEVAKKQFLRSTAVSALPTWRRILAMLAIACFLISVSEAIIGVHLARQATDYLAQADIAVPFVLHGIEFNLAAVLLSSFGVGKLRVIMLLLSITFLAWQLLCAISLY